MPVANTLFENMDGFGALMRIMAEGPVAATRPAKVDATYNIPRKTNDFE
jgi:hypothetical protein